MPAKNIDEDLKYVRREKLADESVRRKLEEVYGAVKLTHHREARVKRWDCPSCGYVNFENRMVCGQCLDPSPFATGTRPADVKVAGQSLDRETSILRLGSRCFRIVSSSAEVVVVPVAAAVPTLREDLMDERCADDEDDTVMTDENGKFVAKLSIPTAMVKYMLGEGGHTLRETQRITGTTITVPNASPQHDDVVDVIISGDARHLVQAALLRIDAILQDRRWNTEATHAITLPLSRISSLQQAASELFANIAATCIDESRGFVKELLQSPQRLHITLCVLKVLNQDDVERAVDIFNSLHADVVEMLRGNLSLTVEGVDIMNDDPWEAHVAYLEVAGPAAQALTKLVQFLHERFGQESLCDAEQAWRQSKLHVTIANSKFASQGGGTRRSFDATVLLHRYKGASLGTHRIAEVEFNALGTKRHSEDGYYPSMAAIKLM